MAQVLYVMVVGIFLVVIINALETWRRSLWRSFGLLILSHCCLPTNSAFFICWMRTERSIGLPRIVCTTSCMTNFLPFHSCIKSVSLFSSLFSKIHWINLFFFPAYLFVIDALLRTPIWICEFTIFLSVSKIVYMNSKWFAPGILALNTLNSYSNIYELYKREHELWAICTRHLETWLQWTSCLNIYGFAHNIDFLQGLTSILNAPDVAASSSSSANGWYWPFGTGIIPLVDFK